MVAASGTFGVADRHRLNTRAAERRAPRHNVQFVRFTMRRPQVVEAGGTCPGPFSGCDFMDMSELEVYGAPS